MATNMKKLLYILLFCTLFNSNFANTANANSIKCSKQAIEQARKLLDFHVGGDDRIEINPKVRELPSFKNPANPRQILQVLEVWGYIYKGSYRMRLIYYNSANINCLLMGQEILENANL